MPPHDRQPRDRDAVGELRSRALVNLVHLHDLRRVDALRRRAGALGWMPAAIDAALDQLVADGRLTETATGNLVREGRLFDEGAR